MDDMFQTFSIPSCQLYATQQLPSAPQYVTGHKLSIFGRRRKSSMSFEEDDNNPCEIKKRNIMHRDIERPRRQEMATLYASLRSLLPLEYLKGKRSISDQMQEAVNYIKHLHGKIENLSNQRDKLQKLWNPRPSKREDVVIVRESLAGIEIVINTALEERLHLSRVLRLLITQGFSVVSSNSTKVKQRLFYIIESEVEAGRKIDLAEVQQKLTGSINQLVLIRF